VYEFIVSPFPQVTSCVSRFHIVAVGVLIAPEWTADRGPFLLQFAFNGWLFIARVVETQSAKNLYKGLFLEAAYPRSGIR
jgi:hypothetical protein